MKEPKTFHIRTYGCQMNELDSELIAGQLLRRGLVKSEEEGADVLILNTCSIRDQAERKVMGKVGRMAKLKERPIIGITGCMANAKKEKLFQKLPHIDFVVGTNNIGDVNSVLDEVLSSGKQSLRVEDRFEENLDYLSAYREDRVKASVSIIRGCDKFCTYCVVPYTRGAEVSRPMESILQECRHLADKGYKEVMLLGQNVNSWGNDKPEWNVHFHDLLYQIDKIPGLERVRFLTSHPVDISQALMEAVRDLRTLCEFVHFPMQAGSNRILRKMHRIYTIEQYLEKVAQLKEIVPGVSLGTDIIVGFPTETEEEFQETYRLMEQIRYSCAFLYSYSPRKGTPAMRFTDDIPEAVKEERLQRLMTLHQEISSQLHMDLVGQEVEVLMESPTKGRTRCWKKVFTQQEAPVGSLVKVQIHGFANQTLIGR